MGKRAMTATQATSTKPPKEGRAYRPDNEVPGLMVRTTPAGVRSWVLAYRLHGRRRLDTLGRVDDMPLADARDEARRRRRDAHRGEDPRSPKVQPRAATLTLARLVADFIADREAELAPKTVSEYKRMAKAYLGPEGALLARSVGRADVKTILQRVSKRGEVQANRLFQLLRAALRHGAAEDLLDTVPVLVGRKLRHKETPRERYLRDEEIRVLLHVLKPHPSRARGPAVAPKVAALVRVLLLLGQRTGETLAMRWADMTKGADARWEIPGAHRKGGRVHVLPLPPAVLQILKGLPRDGERVFGMSAWNRVRWWAPIRERVLAILRRIGRSAGREPEPFTLHDLRRSCATGCAALGASRMTVSRLLGHAVLPGVGVTHVYDRYDGLPEVRAALTAWSAHVGRVVAGGTRAEVIPMRRGRR